MPLGESGLEVRTDCGLFEWSALYVFEEAGTGYIFSCVMGIGPDTHHGANVGYFVVTLDEHQ